MRHATVSQSWYHFSFVSVPHNKYTGNRYRSPERLITATSPFVTNWNCRSVTQDQGFGIVGCVGRAKTISGVAGLLTYIRCLLAASSPIAPRRTVPQRVSHRDANRVAIQRVSNGISGN